MGKKDITVVTYKQGNGKPAMTAVDSKTKALLQAAGRLIKSHKQ